MNLPNAENAYVEERKITKYLLSLDNERGRGKALFFLAFGFRISRWEVFAEALLAHCQRYEVLAIEDTPYGVQYAIVGMLETPDGRNPEGVRSVWQIDHGDDRPRLISAYPDSSRRR